MSTRSRRLAGIQFVDVPPLLPEKLPRMDIAVFVGFASAGPLHTPVAIEDAGQFTALFGGDLPLAWDTVAGQTVSSHLGPAIRAFFRNGGRRCWVIRVGGLPARDASDLPDSAPETAVFPLAGLACFTGRQLAPAFARARSPGTWFDTFRSTTALLTSPLATTNWSQTSVEISAAGQADVAAGDLLRLTFEAEGMEAYFQVNAVEAQAVSPPHTRADRFTAEVSPVGCVRWISPAELLGSSPFSVAWQRRPGETESSTAEVLLTDDSPPSSSVSSQLQVPPDFSPPPGTLLLLTHGALSVFLLVDRVDAAISGLSSVAEMAVIVGRAFEFSTTLPTPATMSKPDADKLSFELRVQRGSSETFRLSDLGFTSAHARYWNALPNDAEVFGTTETARATAIADNEAQALLIEEVSDPRFPLSGDQGTQCFLPIGMSALPDLWMDAEHTRRDPLVREGLEHFSSALFLDPRLQGSVLDSLLPDADFFRYQAPGARPLRGIHAAIGIEEATLIAVPDGIHRSWQPAPPTLPLAPLPSVSVPHPRWWHFLPCDPPASPPAHASGPESGQFLDCGLRVVTTPRISEIEGSSRIVLITDATWLFDASGSYRVKWSTPDLDVRFILEEASLPDFSDAVARDPTTSSQHAFLARESGVYYYRVRAEAEGESSDWSNGVAVRVGIPPRWELEPIAKFSDEAVLELHRALLRLCAARADVVSILSLPGHWRKDDALTYVAVLKSGSHATNDVLPLGDGESRAFSYAAVYHPWVLERDPASEPVLRPPDGNVTGAIARRSLSRGAWIAPANDPLAGIIGLQPVIRSEQYLDLLNAQINLIRQEPHGLLVLSADTLSDDPDLRPLNIRRLMILLRRAALQLGNTYVFEPNDLTLRRVVRGSFESMLQRLFMRGAFAGATADASYRVELGDDVNTPQAMDRGQFFVELKIAPALPLSFITLRLVQIGEQATVTESN